MNAEINPFVVFTLLYPQRKLHLWNSSGGELYFLLFFPFSKKIKLMKVLTDRKILL